MLSNNSGNAFSHSNSGWKNSNGAFDPALLAGIAAYRRHPYCRTLTDPPTIWQNGASRLLDYGTGGGQLSVLFVPSLINRAYILDLMANHSFLRWLAMRGIRPLLLDWGWPGQAEQQFSLSDYVVQRLEPALVHCGAGTVLAGYCMGGLLAIAASVRRPDLVGGLALLATPWDFHASDCLMAQHIALSRPMLESLLPLTNALPVDVLQSWFTSVDPEAVPRKYRAFGRLAPDTDRARLFVAIEDWVNDGVPLAVPVARECVADWYGDSAPSNGRWRIADQIIDPANLRLPTFLAVPHRDRLVPPDSALALVSLIPDAILHRPENAYSAGHVGMIAGPRAETALWEPLLAWLNTHPHMA